MGHGNLGGYDREYMRFSLFQNGGTGSDTFEDDELLQTVYCMPEVVQKYIDTNDFREVDKIQRSLLQGYLYDIAHYATAEEKVKAEKCYLSLAKQLLDKENHKFQYKEVDKNILPVLSGYFALIWYICPSA